MDNLAGMILDHLWLLYTVESDEAEDLDFDHAANLLEVFADDTENRWSEAERQALSDAAKRSLAILLSEPDKYGYTPRKQVTPKLRAFLESLAAGSFNDFSGLEEEI